MDKKKQPNQAFLKQINEKVPEGVNCDTNRPNVDYQIDHVYGFSGDRAKAVCYFGATTNQIVFPTAALGVVQDVASRKQKYFGGVEKDKEAEKYVKDWPFHQDDITTLDTAGGEFRNIVASGECGK